LTLVFAVTDFRCLKLLKDRSVVDFFPHSASSQWQLLQTWGSYFAGVHFEPNSGGQVSACFSFCEVLLELQMLVGDRKHPKLSP
jgi:hypothetical protein